MKIVRTDFRFWRVFDSWVCDTFYVKDTSSRAGTFSWEGIGQIVDITTFQKKIFTPPPENKHSPKKTTQKGTSKNELLVAQNLNF